MKVTNLQEADFEKIEKFNQEVYPLRKGISEGFAHRFSENPYRKPDFNSSYFLEDDEQKIVGQFLLMPSEFFYREKSFPCNWGMDYILKEESFVEMLSERFLPKRHSKIPFISGPIFQKFR